MPLRTHSTPVIPQTTGNNTAPPVVPHRLLPAEPVVSPTQQNILETIRARTTGAIYTPVVNRPHSVEAPRHHRSIFHHPAIVDRLNTNHRLSSGPRDTSGNQAVSEVISTRRHTRAHNEQLPESRLVQFSQLQRHRLGTCIQICVQIH